MLETDAHVKIGVGNNIRQHRRRFLSLQVKKVPDCPSSMPAPFICLRAAFHSNYNTFSCKID